MGVPQFYRWLTLKYSRIATKRNVRNTETYFQRERTASLALDVNSVIHLAAARVYRYGQYEVSDKRVYQRLRDTPQAELEQQHFAEVTNELLTLLELTKPESTLIIAVDGPAPYTKLYQQRQRRYKAKSKLLGTTDSYQRYDALAYESNSPWDSNAITPGTPFMARLDHYLQAWIEANRAVLPPRVIYSSHQAPGEGEHKIMQHYRTLQWSQQHQRLQHVVVGLDADLIMLSLLSPLKRITLLRDDINQTGDIYHMLDVELTRQHITAELGSVADFVLLTFFAGNDFLPANPAISIGNNGLDRLLSLYKEHDHYLIFKDTHRINWPAFTGFIARLAAVEAELLLAEYSAGAQFPSVALQASVKQGSLDYERFRELHYERALAPKTGGAELPDRLSQKQTLVEEWLAGLAWTYKYYNEGMDGVNVEWSLHFNHAPLAGEMLKLLQTDDGSYDFAWSAIDRRGRTLLPFEQLLSVLPPASAKLLPATLAELLLNSKSVIADLYPSKFVADLSGKHKDFEAVALLPYIDGERVRAAMVGRALTADERARNQHASDRFYKQYRLR